MYIPDLTDLEYMFDHHNMRTITKCIRGLPKCGILAIFSYFQPFLARLSDNERFSI